MTVKISTGFRNYANDSGAKGAFDGGSGRIAWLSGTAPANGNAAAAGTVLATSTLASTAFEASNAGVLTAASIGNTTVGTGGTVSHGIIYRTGDTSIADAADTTDRRIVFDVAETSGGDVNFDETEWVSGGTVAITSLTLTLPADNS